MVNELFCQDRGDKTADVLRISFTGVHTLRERPELRHGKQMNRYENGEDTIELMILKVFKTNRPSLFTEKSSHNRLELKNVKVYLKSTVQEFLYHLKTNSKIYNLDLLAYLLPGKNS